VKAVVDISPFNAVTRRTAASDGMTAEIIQGTGRIKTEFRFRAPIHLLVVCEEATRDQGESFVEGLPRSTLRTLSRKITFVPAGHEYFEWHQPRKLTRLFISISSHPSSTSWRTPESLTFHSRPAFSLSTLHCGILR